MTDGEKIMAELRELRRQVNDDFEFNSRAFKEMAQSMRDLTERMTQVEGRTRLQEQRFNRMLDLVESTLVNLEVRIDALEQGGNTSAA